MVYLTQFHFNRSRRHTRFLLSNPQALHAQVLSSFSPEQVTQNEHARVLWRVDQGQHQSTLYIVSPERPDLTGFVEDAGWPSTETWKTRDYTSRLENLKQGQKWGFRLKANPVASVRASADQMPRDDGVLVRSRGVRRPHVTPKQQLEWLIGKGSQFGFEIPDLGHGMGATVTERRDVAFSKRSDSGNSTSGRKVTLRVAQFDGVLAVTNPVKLREGLAFGIGPAKGYGCGLLTLVPVRE